MRSRILLGIGAWVLGAAAATAGSVYAVDELGQGLLAQHAKQISVAKVNSELALEKTGRTSAAVSPSSSLSVTPSPNSRTRQRPAPAHNGGSAGHTRAPASKLLTSRGGTTAASCGNGLASLLYWSPAQGFEADDVSKGPARVASVSFTDSAGGVLMRITCTSAGVPAAHVSQLSLGGGSHHDE